MSWVRENSVPNTGHPTLVFLSYGIRGDIASHDPESSESQRNKTFALFRLRLFVISVSDPDRYIDLSLNQVDVWTVLIFCFTSTVTSTCLSLEIHRARSVDTLERPTFICRTLTQATLKLSQGP